MIASLPMYARPELALAHSTLWNTMRDTLRDNGIQAPDTLSDGEDLSFWRRDDLLFSQTCGMPLREHLHADVAYVTTPDYGIPDCKAGYYNSVFISRDAGVLADFDGASFALNGTNSQSGFAAPITAANAIGITFAMGLISGGHRNSYQAVQNGTADIAAIDALTWHYIQQFDAPNVHIVGVTEQTPTLPYICSKTAPMPAVKQALQSAIHELTGEDRHLLRINGLVDIPLSDYLAVTTPKIPFPLKNL
jgi:ABC-type phosphate/phosphonate transport system substrate-binding protein